MSTLTLNNTTAAVRTWSERTDECIPHGPAQIREHVYLDANGSQYIGDVVYLRRPAAVGSEYGWCREGLAYTNPKVLPRIRLRSKGDAIAALVHRHERHSGPDGDFLAD